MHDRIALQAGTHQRARDMISAEVSNVYTTDQQGCVMQTLIQARNHQSTELINHSLIEMHRSYLGLFDHNLDN